jgi:small multidrug resistance family-3 protein
LLAGFFVFQEVLSMNYLDRLVSNPLGAFTVLCLAAFLEAYGDSFFQVSFYRSSGWGRVAAFVAGAVVLAAYGSVVNVPRWDFGKLLGVYVVLFFLMAQLLAKLRFGQSPTPPIYAGGSLIVAGGLVIAFWKG